MVCSRIQADQQRSETPACLLHRRMAPHSSALLLLLMGSVVSPGRCQHWSYGLSPGGKRELDGLADTVGSIVEGFHVDTPCGVLRCADESPFPKVYRLKGFLDGVADRENGHRTYRK